MLLSVLLVRQIKLTKIHFLYVHCKVNHVIVQSCCVNIKSAREADYAGIMPTVQVLSAQRGKKNESKFNCVFFIPLMHMMFLFYYYSLVLFFFVVKVYMVWPWATILVDGVVPLT